MKGPAMKITMIKEAYESKLSHPLGATRPGTLAAGGMGWLIFDAGGELFKYQCKQMNGPTRTANLRSGRPARSVRVTTTSIESRWAPIAVAA